MPRAKYITEVLTEINNDTSLLKTEYRMAGDGGPLGAIFRHAYLPEGKFLLPDSDPHYKRAPEPMGLTPAKFQTEIRKFYIFCRKDLSQVKREQMFIQLLEGIHPDEAKVLLAIKDQKLDTLYPNLKYNVIADAGFIPPRTAQKAKEDNAQVKKSVRPRGRPPKSENLPQPQ